MTASQSSANLDQILKELEERFASATPSSTPTQKKKQSRYPLQKLLGAIAFIIITAGIASAAYLVQTGQDLRQIASENFQMYYTGVAGFFCTGLECTTARDWTQSEEWVCITNNAVFPHYGDCMAGCDSAACQKVTSSYSVKCEPDQKVARFHCRNGLGGSNICTESFVDVTGAVRSAIGSPMAPGKKVNMDVLMPDKCGAYQFDFQETGTPDNSISSPCGGVVYIWNQNCDGTTPPPPPPSTPPAPSCTVDLFLRVNGQNVAPDKDNHFYLDYKEPFTLRGRVTNIENGRVDFVRFVALENQIFTPTASVDTDSPYEATFTATALGAGKIRANVRYEGKDDPICSDEVVIRSKGSCNDICTVDNDCRVAQGLRCLAAGEGVNRCRKPEYPNSETCEAPEPTPLQPGVCLWMRMDNVSRAGQTPQAGDVLNFTCSPTTTIRYRHRLIQPDGTVVNLTKPTSISNISQNYTVPANMTGKFVAQCSICNGQTDDMCSPWEEVPGIELPDTSSPTSPVTCNAASYSGCGGYKAGETGVCEPVNGVAHNCQVLNDNDFCGCKPVVAQSPISTPVGGWDDDPILPSGSPSSVVPRPSGISIPSVAPVAE